VHALGWLAHAPGRLAHRRWTATPRGRKLKSVLVQPLCGHPGCLPWGLVRSTARTPTAQRAREPRVFLVEARALRDDATLEGALLWREWRVEADTEDTSSSPTLRRVERETEVTTVRAPSAATGPRREARLATCSLFFVVAADATLWASLLPRREHSHAAGGAPARRGSG